MTLSGPGRGLADDGGAWAGFVAFLRAGVPGLGHVEPDTPIEQAVDGANGRTILRLVLARHGRVLPDDLVASITTVGEAYEWCRATAEPSGAGGDPLDVALVPVLPEHHALLYQAALDPASGGAWRWRGATPSFDAFVRSLHDGTLCAYLVAERPGGAIHGHVALYDARFDAGTAQLAYQRLVPRPGGGQMLLGLFLLIEHAFTSWPFRKLYAQVPGYNAHLVAGLDPDLVREEGRLVDHDFHAGRWWDLVTVAVWRDDWERWAPGWRRLLGLAADPA